MGYYIHYVNTEVLYPILIAVFILFSKNQKRKIYFLKLSFSVVLPWGEVSIIYWILYTIIDSMKSKYDIN